MARVGAPGRQVDVEVVGAKVVATRLRDGTRWSYNPKAEGKKWSIEGYEIDIPYAALGEAGVDEAVRIGATL